MTGHTECLRVDGAGVGKAELVAAGIVDANHSPRTVETLPFVVRGGYSCARIPHHGTVVLLHALPAGMSQEQPSLASSRKLTDCQVTLLAPLNLRDGPQGASLKVLPARVRLTALERTANWILVDYHGESGWVSARYVATSGDCG